MKRQNDGASKRQIWLFGSLGVLCAFLLLAAASAQQDRRTDKASGRNDIAQQPDRPAIQGVQRREEQRQPTDQRQPADQRQREERSEPSRDQSQAQSRGQRQGLGIQFDQQAQGLSVAGVQQGTAAAQAGLRQGDRIVAADGRQFRSARQLQAYLGGQWGRRVPMVIERGGRQYTVQFALPQPQSETAWLGVYLNDNEEDEKGAIVAQVYPTGPAARAGLQFGDVIQQVNGQSVATSADLIAAIEEMQPGNKVELSLLRNNEPTKVTATLGSRDSFVFRGQSDDRWAARGSGYEDDEENDDPYNIPPYAMELEHNRRMAEQHERIETEIAKLRDEVRQLREALQKR
jgi:membrane-associated protease RseP (regulator of RpoE activity)